MSSVNFTVPKKTHRSFDPKSTHDQMLLANRIASIRYGDAHCDSPAEMNPNGLQIQIYPQLNNLFLVLPGEMGLDNNHFRLVSTCENEETLHTIVLILRKFF